MKSFTDLEQSKKLSSILQLTSADMFYSYDYIIDKLEEDPRYSKETLRKYS